MNYQFLRSSLRGIASLLLISQCTVAYANDLTDGEIIAIYNQVNSFDIETAYVGQLYGSTEAVRKLATMVATDHTGVRHAAQGLAREINVVLKLPESRVAAFETHFDSVKSLRSLSGSEFDKAYLDHEIEFHTQAMSAVREALLPAAKHPQLKAHFESVLPHFEHHLNETKRVASELGYR